MKELNFNRSEANAYMTDNTVTVVNRQKAKQYQIKDTHTIKL